MRTELVELHMLVYNLLFKTDRIKLSQPASAFKQRFDLKSVSGIVFQCPNGKNSDRGLAH